MFRMAKTMKKPNCVFSIAFAIAAFAVAASADAYQTYDFVFEQSNFNVTEGSTVDIDFLLRETITGGETARLAVGGGDGLFFYGVNADFSIFTGTAGSTVASDADVAINAIFDDPDSSVDLLAGSVDILGGTEDSDEGINVAPVSPNVFEVNLGTITVTAGDVGSVTTISLADHTNTAAVFTLFTDGTIIDDIATYGSTDVTVVAVPEPTSALILAGIAGIGLIQRRRK